MVTEHYEDGEGEILGRVRRVVGADLPLVASLDFHANLTEAMTELATALTIYRTYPHIDMDATGGRARSLAAAARLCCIAAIFEVERRPAAIEGADRSALLLGGAP